jgi:hypothetical protein
MAEMCKVRVTIRKTVQEQQYEPLMVELSTEAEVPVEDRDRKFDAMFKEVRDKTYELLENHINGE